MIDWEQRRYEIAKDVVVSNFKMLDEDWSVKQLVSHAICVADILIKELEK